MESDELREIGLTEGEFVFPTDLAIPELTSTDVIEVLAGPSRRGRQLFGALFYLSLAGFGLALLMGNDRPLTIGCGVAGAIFGGLLFFLKKNQRLAAKIGFDPSQVSWAHPTLLVPAGTTELAHGITYATFHLRNGKTLQVALPRVGMVAVFQWLRRQNPDVRLTGEPPASSR